MSTQKIPSIREKARTAGISATHYCDVVAGRANASVRVALELERLEGKNFLFFVDRSRFDEHGRRREGDPRPASAP